MRSQRDVSNESNRRARLPGSARATLWRAWAGALVFVVLAGGFWGIAYLRSHGAGGNPHGAVQLFALGPNVAPGGITLGPDGNIWVTEPSRAPSPPAVVRITPAGAMTVFPVPQGTVPYGIIAGPGDSLWFWDADGPRLARMTTAGAVTEYALPDEESGDLGGLIVGPDGNLWYTGVGRIGRVTPAGVATTFRFPADEVSEDIQMPIIGGPDGNLWAYDVGRTVLWRITPHGAFTPFGLAWNPGCACGALTLAPDGTFWATTMSDALAVSTSGEVLHDYQLARGKLPLSITVGRDRALWLLEAVTTGQGPEEIRIAQMGPSGALTEFAVPTVPHQNPGTAVTPGVGTPALVVGRDGALWFLDHNAVGRFTP